MAIAPNIDDSVQPYGLVIPKNYDSTKKKTRLDIWCHGRGEKLTELSFINGRFGKRGRNLTTEYDRAVHLYGRYCNANKFAGEVDCFEAIADAKKHYNIDDDRIIMRGFSMGGAACWQFATHFPVKRGVLLRQGPASPRRLTF